MCTRCLSIYPCPCPFHPARRQLLPVRKIAPSEPVYSRLARYVGVCVFVGGVFGLPLGHLLWPAAVVYGVAPSLLSDGKASVGSPAAFVWGMGFFAGCVPYIGLPYRPELLYGLLAAVGGMGYLKLWLDLAKSHRRILATKAVVGSLLLTGLTSLLVLA